ncbi:hypothetical protein HPP92_020620 [Vanilla planifolia]|uniref:Regulator of rDNA transcription protein 15 n=1 Tax=Vanilla planifolia TaxID=51239 RepID=A0A835Q5J6_VANPL|nr:hypothetical protein HPP92_020620 [Vanilla planifolia]
MHVDFPQPSKSYYFCGLQHLYIASFFEKPSNSLLYLFNQTSFYPFVPHEISVLVELILGHLRYLLTDVPPQPNSPPDNVFRPDRLAEARLGAKRRGWAPPPSHGIKSSSTGSSFPADSAKPVPLAVVSLDSRWGSQSRTHWLSADCSSCLRSESGLTLAGWGTNWEPSPGVEQSTQNWYGHGESDCLIKTKHCDGPRGCSRNVISAQCSECQSEEIQPSVGKRRE